MKYLLLFLSCLVIGSAQQIEDVSNSMSDAVNGFGIDMYRTVVGNAGTKDVVFSPFSISTIMAMLYKGAKENSKAEVAKAIKLDTFKESTINREYVMILMDFAKAKETTLLSSNGVWPSKDFTMTGKFRTFVIKYFMSHLERLDYGADPEVARARINEFVSKATDGQINDLLSQGSVTGSTALVLTNAVKFSGKWHPNFFSKDGPAKFYYDGEMSQEMEFMSGSSKKFGYAGLDNMEIARVEFVGRRRSMYFVLPNYKDGYSMDDVENFIADNGAIKLREMLDTAQNNEMVGDITLPMMTVDNNFDMVKILKQMGVNDVFDVEKANLLGVCANPENPLYVSSSVHKAYIKIDEEGCEAAGASSVVIMPGSGYYPDKIRFKADRPFLYFLRDDRTKVVLFMGRFTGQPE